MHIVMQIIFSNVPSEKPGFPKQEEFESDCANIVVLMDVDAIEAMGRFPETPEDMQQQQVAFTKFIHPIMGQIRQHVLIEPQRKLVDG